MDNKKVHSYTRKYTLQGFLFSLGAYFILLLIDLDINGMHFTFSNVYKLHQINPFFWAIDTLPILNTLVSFYIGRKIGKNVALTEFTIDSEKEKTGKIIQFTENLRSGKINIDVENIAKDDVLAKALRDLQNDLKDSKVEEAKRRKEDAQRNWTSEGLAQFGEILRNDNDNIEVLSYNIISNLVKYLKANQGGVFIINENENNEKYFDMTACYAYDRKKFANKRLEWGEGLIGTCALEQEKILLTDVPDEYVDITSGLGNANPRAILIVPLKINDEIHGVIEIASFNVFEKFEIDFVEKISESIASTISTVKINIQTARLLKDSQDQARILADQEEKMRQNMEELRATQEEATRQGIEFENFTNSVDYSLIRAEYTTKGLLTYANKQFLKNLSYASLGEIKNKHINTFIDKKSHELFEKILSELLEGKSHYEGDMKYITKEGKELWTTSTYVCVKDHHEEIQKILYLGIDITHKKRQNLDYQGQIEALHRSSIKAEFNTEGHVLFINDLFVENLKYSTADLMDKSVFDLLPKKDIKTFKNIWQNVVNGNAFKDQIKFESMDNEERWLQATFSAVHDMYGDVAKIILIAHDITEQKYMELEAQKQAQILKEQEATLLQNVEEMKSIQNEMEKKNILIEAEKTKSLAILEGCVEGIVTFDNKGKIDSFNKAAESIFNLNKVDVIGKKINKYFPLEIEKNEDSIKVIYVTEAERISLENNVKLEIWIHNDFIQQKSVLLTLLEISSGENISFTAFFQDIEVELF
ncbi:MAG TPA: hypothetical protein DDX39_01670 [Bacteroidales bacterium]|nr:MAG: hypothetical protein A2W98_07885 [Bacteroidetes bacterium GWF2_33_38]OFY92259.1 MAG: hypothetical protein A2236_09140 [Bacteroidetes bacterium RIFOXYA2_FULL_33_7]HBF87320.1 hypothetical protein [Bacteroidales bacterium]